ncbi:MAG: hypothetical protein UHD09_03810 [Bifidobacterium sp.]|nr:hypothetical protein [Bifidobacterium sp.]
MAKGPGLTDEQKAAVAELAQPPAHAGESKVRIFMQLPNRDKPEYFRQHFLVPLAAAAIAVALVAFVAVRVAARDERPALYAAVVDSTLPLGEAAKLQDAYAAKLGQDVVIDDYFDTAKDGLSKLQTMIANEQIDVVIAPPSTFAELASYGYLTDLKTALPAAQYGELHAYAQDFHGFDDSHVTDQIDQSGTGQGEALPYGLTLADAATWHAYASDDAAMVGIVANTRQGGNAQAFIDYLYQRPEASADATAQAAR